MIVTTASGTQYEFNGKRQVRRCTYTGGGELRRDDEWLNLQRWPDIDVGLSMVLILEPLGEGDVTVRTTSPVTQIANPARMWIFPEGHIADLSAPTVAELEGGIEITGYFE